MSDLLTLKFIKAGLYTTIQDLGRPGHQDEGVPFGGALDRTAMATANLLVGNDVSEPVLEITMTGPAIEFGSACTISITGAGMQPELNGESIPEYTCVEIGQNSVLSFGHLQHGCRAYLAIRGSWQVRRWLGSASALRIGSTDIVPGAVIRKGMKINIMSSAADYVTGEPRVARAEKRSQYEIRVFPGPEFRSFTGEQIAYFFNTEFQLTTDINRIGCRLQPELPNYIPPADFISSGIVPGTIQVARQGQAVILLADAQTTGGYPRIANVCDADLDLLAQLKPGDKVRFKILKRG